MAPEGPWRRRDRTAGLLSLLAGGAHGVVTPQHFQEWWGYGLFFVFAGAAQVLFGLALLTGAINPTDAGHRWHVHRRRLYLAGIWGNLAIIALYLVTRTVGIPLLGPEAGEVETVATIDVVSKLLEVALVVVLWRTLHQEKAAPWPGMPT